MRSPYATSEPHRLEDADHLVVGEGGLDGTDAAELRRGEMEGRRQAIHAVEGGDADDRIVTASQCELQEHARVRRIPRWW